MAAAGFGERGGERLAVGHVHAQVVAAARVGRRLEVEAGDLPAALDEAAADREADARGAPGDEGVAIGAWRGIHGVA
jgi:hypothetical protein